MKRIAAGILGGIWLATAAAAGSGLIAMKDRGDMLGWEAVGRIDMKGHGFCTGVLISSTEVLTAGHCVVDDAGQPIPPERVNFSAGYLNGKALHHRAARRIVVAEGYDGAQTELTLENIRRDVALIQLDSPVFISEADPFVVHTGHVEEADVQVMSYGRGREEAMSWQRQCALLQNVRGLLVFDCDTTFGSSGAPVFLRHDHRIRVLSLVSGGATSEGEKVTLGMELAAVVDELKRALRYQTAPVTNATSGPRRIKVGGGNASGAKFVKP